MKKFIVISGFLGAGKTTTMMALSEYINKKGKKAAIISNDLGAKNLVDAKFSETNGYDIVEITGNCICYQTENLVDKLRRLFDYQHANVVMSDIPGCGVGALDHVYHKLNNEYHNEFQLAPFTVIADPKRLCAIMPEGADINLPEEMNYLFRSQLKEADLVALNKIDLLSKEEIDTYMSFLKSFCPDATVFAISAQQQTNVDQLADYILSQEAQLKVVDIGYGGPEFAAAEKKLSWYNSQFFVKHHAEPIDGNDFVVDYMGKISTLLKDYDRNVPHLKVYADGVEGDSCKFSLLGVDYPIEEDRRLKQNTTSLKVVVNARASCESKLLDEIMKTALYETAGKLGFESHVFFTECFGMMDEGRA